MLKATTPHFYAHKKRSFIASPDTINVLHVAFEYANATLGGLGAVATQMVNAQNVYVDSNINKFNASIITPYYAKLFADYASVRRLTIIEHLYDFKTARTAVLLVDSPNGKHYMLQPLDSNMFDSINSVNDIYNDHRTSKFIDRVRFFNSAVAAYLMVSALGPSHPTPQMLILHDWHTALIAKLLKDTKSTHHPDIKSILIVHVGNVDCGAYSREQLQGIGLEFSPGWHLVKAIGLVAADKVIAVSRSFLEECMSFKSDDPGIDSIRKLFILHALYTKKAIGILNGFDHTKYCLVRSLDPYISSMHAKKMRLTQALAQEMNIWHPNWHIDASLPVVFFIGRFSHEKINPASLIQIINLLKGRAIFFTLARGMTPELFSIIKQHSEKTNNVFISDDPIIQQRLGARMRACATFGFGPSERDACCVTLFEGFANGTPFITTGVGGMKDIISEFKFTDENNTSGNSFIYQQKADGDNPDLTSTVNTALGFWARITPRQKDAVFDRIIEESKRHDWLAPNGALAQYEQTFNEMLAHSPTRAKRSRSTA